MTTRMAASAWAAPEDESRKGWREKCELIVKMIVEGGGVEGGGVVGGGVDDSVTGGAPRWC